MKKKFILLGVALTTLPLATIVGCSKDDVDQTFDFTNADPDDVIAKLTVYIEKQEPNKTLKIKFINKDKSFIANFKTILKKYKDGDKITIDKKTNDELLKKLESIGIHNIG